MDQPAPRETTDPLGDEVPVGEPFKDLDEPANAVIPAEMPGEVIHAAPELAGIEQIAPAQRDADKPQTRAADWERELNSQRVAAELNRVETEVRKILEPRDPKRKRKLLGTRNWYELEEDIISWRYTGRFDEPTLQQLRELIVHRHHLFDHLRFLASTRPTWNT